MTTDKDSDRLERFRQAGSFAVYYGRGQSEILSQYDIAIVEPAGQNEQSLAALQAAGTLTIAYVSITEIPEYDPHIKMLRPSDYLNVNGSVVSNVEYRTALADLRSKNWVNLLFHRIGRLIRLADYDGIFMDTISNVEWTVLPAGVRAEQQAAAVEIVRHLRTLYPGHILLQNNGLETICEQTAPYINAVCWENPDFVSPETFRWHENVRLRLQRLARKHGIRVLALLEEGVMEEPRMESAVYWAGREQYLVCRSARHYLDVSAPG